MRTRRSYAAGVDASAVNLAGGPCRYLVVSGFSCVIGEQRLARRLCEGKREMKLTAEVLRRNVSASGRRSGPSAAPAGDRLRGRVGLYEAMHLTEEIRALILEKQAVDVLSGPRWPRAGRDVPVEVLRSLGGTA